MSLSQQIAQLQWLQLKHDECYHKDIWLLSVQRRINHMVLHLAKYGAKLVVASSVEDIADFNKIALDSLIISMSTANILNLSIFDMALSESEKESLSIDDLAKNLARAYEDKSLYRLSAEYCKPVSVLCKSVESLDHLEPYSFRESISESIIAIFRVSLAIIAMYSEGLIVNKISNRLYEVEKKNIFFKKLGNYKDEYHNVLERR